MNYCFNCGAELMDKDQKFCIKCGTNLEKYKDKYNEYLRQSHSKYNKMEGESYNDYLERINSPLKDKIATKEGIEHEKEDYINYDLSKHIKKTILIDYKIFSEKFSKINHYQTSILSRIILEIPLIK